MNNTKLDHEKMISENFADVFGLKLTINTLKKYIIDRKLNNNELESFFKKWAVTMRQIISNKLIDQDDVHAPTVIRINSPYLHINEFYDLYNISSESNNYLEKNLRTIILDNDDEF